MIPLLKGLRILDLTSVILGPYATQILGDLGAEIVKVEPPEGDSMRPVAPQAAPGLSAIFANCNRNKRSVVLDLKTEAGKAALHEADPDRRRLRPQHAPGGDGQAGLHLQRRARRQPQDRLRRRHRLRPPRPLRRQARLRRRDPGRLAALPACSRCATARPLYAPTIAADKVSGLHLAYALLAALLYRERSGEAPGYVEVPMFELMAAFSLCEHLGGATFEEDGKVGYIRVISPSRRPYKTKDGWVAVLPYTERNWTKVLAEIGRADVAEHAWFKNATERSSRVDELYDILAVALPARTTAEWLATFERLDIPSQPVRLPADLLTDPHLADVGFFTPSFAQAYAGHAHPAPAGQRRGGAERRPTSHRRCSAPTPPTCCARPAAARPRSPRPCRPPNAADARGGPC